MAKKKAVSKVNKEELVEQIKATPIVPSEMFSEPITNIGDTSNIMAKTPEEESIKGGPELVEDNGLGMDQVEDSPMTLEELTEEYKLMRQVSYQMIEKQYVVEWKLFGEDFKGKYRILQVAEGMWLMGTTHLDLKYIPALTKKAAYEKYIEEEG